MNKNTLPPEMIRDQRTIVARQHVDTAEAWLRKIIHHQLSINFGANYISTLASDATISKKYFEHVVQIKVEKSEIVRDVDATTFDQVIDLITHPKLFDRYFKKALYESYGLGREHARIYLSILKDIRNDVSHGRNCSLRQIEQAICYSNDLIDSIKSYFRSINMQREYNVPMIVRYVDSLGNESHLEDVPETIGNRIIDWRRRGHADLYPGDTLTCEVEIDQSYDSSEYKVYWFVFGFPKQQGHIANVKIDNQHVCEQMEIGFEVISNKDWHRHHGLDDSLRLLFRVLPPVMA